MCYPLNLRFYQKGGLLPKYLTTKIQIIISNWTLEKIYERKHNRIKNLKKYICIIIGWDYALLHALNIMDKKDGNL